MTTYDTREHLYGAGGVYAVTDDVSDSAFEDAIADARAEGNLSRANVVRKIKNLPTYSEQQTAKWHQIRDLAAQRLTSAQIARQVGMTEQGLRSGARREGITFPADEAIGKSRRVDGNDVLERIIASLEANENVIELIDFSRVSVDDAHDMLDRLAAAMRPINHIRKQLKEISRGYCNPE